MLPRGLVHTFWNAIDKPVRFLDMFLNQNFDDYLEEFFQIMNDAVQDGPPNPEIAKALQRLTGNLT